MDQLCHRYLQQTHTRQSHSARRVGQVRNMSLIPADNRKLSVMIGILLCVCGSRERHSELTEETYIALRPIPKDCQLVGWLVV